MIWPMIAAMALGGALGGLGGKQKAKAGNKTTLTSHSQITPPSQLGGYDRLNEALNRVRDLPGYHPGQNNPYLGATFNHIFGRAGIPTPEGGFQLPQQFAPPGGPGGQPIGPQSQGPQPGGPQGLPPNLQNNPYLRSMRSY
jgi:hypothetical protein